MVITRQDREPIHEVRVPQAGACCAAARGSASAGSAVLLTAFTTIRLTATTVLAFVLPEVIELKPVRSVRAGQQPVDRSATECLTKKRAQAEDGLRVGECWVGCNNRRALHHWAWHYGAMRFAYWHPTALGRVRIIRYFVPAHAFVRLKLSSPSQFLKFQYRQIWSRRYWLRG